MDAFEEVVDASSVHEDEPPSTPIKRRHQARLRNVPLFNADSGEEECGGRELGPVDTEHFAFRVLSEEEEEEASPEEPSADNWPHWMGPRKVFEHVPIEPGRAWRAELDQELRLWEQWQREQLLSHVEGSLVDYDAAAKATDKTAFQCARLLLLADAAAKATAMDARLTAWLKDDGPAQSGSDHEDTFLAQFIRATTRAEHP